MQSTIDETIERVEQLYTTLTGKRAPHPNGGSVPIPPETDPLLHVQEQLGRMVSVAEQLVAMPLPQATWTPHALGWRDEGGLSIALDVPGVTRDQLQIRVDNGTITVSGQRKPPWTTAPASVDGCDAPLGLFTRSFWIGAPIAPEHVTARLADGVLTIRITANQRGETSQIPIRS
jgi:HSP20 family protein